VSNAGIGLVILFVYFAVLCLIGKITGKKNSNDDFFRAGRKSPWFVVAFGMIGVSLSGVTFLSVPGTVVNKHFSYMEVVLGNMVGYWVMALILLPLYYRLKLTSIYTYLNQRFGTQTYKTGALCFLLSRIVGASLRLFLVAVVLHKLIFEPYGLSFMFTTFLSILLIWTYTFKGGIKTVVWTDTLQTFFLIFALIYFTLTLPGIMGMNFTESFNKAEQLGLTQTFTGWGTFLKSFIFGMFFTVVSNGLDQDMMQKNLTCINLRSAQKNIFSFSLLFVVASFFFLLLGAMLTLYAQKHAPHLVGDELFRNVIEHINSPLTFVIFILGVVAAAYSSADSALASLTTSYCVDIGNIEEKPESEQVAYRRKVHIVFSIILFLIVIIFHSLGRANGNNDVIWTLFKAMGYTYGPLLGLFSFGMLSKRKVNDNNVPWIAIVSPVSSYTLNYFLSKNGHDIGIAILLVNGLTCFILCLIFSQKTLNTEQKIVE